MGEDVKLLTAYFYTGANEIDFGMENES